MGNFPMSAIPVISGLFAVLAVVIFAQGLRVLFRRRLLSGLGLTSAAMVFFAIAAVFLLLASNLHTYQRLVYERPVADIQFTRIRPQLYHVTLSRRDTGKQQLFDLRGDEWQLDAQVLIWKGLASLLGLDAGYRLYRLAGRYRNIKQARQAPRTIYSLLSADTLDASSTAQWQLNDWTLDIWTWAHDYADKLHFVDAIFGSAIFLPMTDGAKYTVLISRTGLLVRPVNKPAREAVRGWINLKKLN